MKLIDKIRGRRSEKQLLEILLLNGEAELSEGLCWATYKLFSKEILNTKEFKYLSTFLSNNRSKFGSPHFDANQVNSVFYWPQGQWKPRKLWLEDLTQYQRTTKELLSLVLSHGEEYVHNGGLCLITLRLKDNEMINEREYMSIMNFIVTHKPQPNSKHYIDMSIHTKLCHLHFWPIGEWEPRKAWLEDQIKNMK
jgi:hypothetical protein